MSNLSKGNSISISLGSPSSLNVRYGMKEECLILEDLMMGSMINWVVKLHQVSFQNCLDNRCLNIDASG